MGNVSPLPLDRNGREIQAGNATHVFTVTMDGTYKAITIPSGQECKSVSIKMQDGREWKYSHTDVATVPYIPYTNLSMDIVAEAGDTIGYANADSGTLAVHLLK